MLLSVDDAVTKLAPLLESKRLMVMAGAGISIDSGLPSWDGLLEELVTRTKTRVERARRKHPAVTTLNAFLDELDDAPNYKYPMRKASVIRERLKELKILIPDNIEDDVTTWFTQRFSNANHNPNHAAIVGTAYPVILTSNYDLLLEQAAEAANYELESYSYTDVQPLAAALFEKTPCIVHVHGKYKGIDEVGDIVFTADDYVRIRRKNPGFTMTLQALFLGYTTLFVGYGSSDPHLEDVLDEMGHYFSTVYRERSFVLLHRSKANKMFVTYKDRFNTDIIAIDDYSQTPAFLERLRAIAPR